MLDRIDFEPLFFAPFVSSVMRVEPAWIDYNGHLNMAYYNVLLDRAVDEAFMLIGCGPDYVQGRQHSCFTAEVHVRYLRELHADDAVRVTFQLLDYDSKRMHYFEQLFHAAEGFRRPPRTWRCMWTWRRRRLPPSRRNSPPASPR